MQATMSLSAGPVRRFVKFRLLVHALLSLVILLAVVTPGIYTATEGKHTLKLNVRSLEGGCNWFPTFITSNVPVENTWRKLDGECTEEDLITALLTLIMSWSGANTVWFLLAERIFDPPAVTKKTKRKKK